MSLITFRIGNLIPQTKPLVSYNPLYFGEDFRGQGGTQYSSLNGVGLSLSLEFPRLTAAEASTLLNYCTLKPSDAFFNLELQDRENIFDGVTESSKYQRILSKVKISSWEFEPILYEDDNSLEKARLTVEEV